MTFLSVSAARCEIITPRAFPTPQARRFVPTMSEDLMVLTEQSAEGDVPGHLAAVGFVGSVRHALNVGS